MPTTTSPPILIWEPGGGTPTWTPAPPPAGHAAPENGLTVLTIGQNYVDVVFVTTQPRADWTFAGLEVVNVTDTAPLNIWVGVATSKTRNGFRVYLNGLPDTGNYYLDWSINGGTVADAGTATTYLLSGPDNGPNGTGTTFTVALPLGATVDSVVTVTPDDGGLPGSFSPATVELTSDMPSANFVYTPGSYGARTITVTNDSLLADPGGIAFTSVVSTYLLSGPGSGGSGTPSTNFTVSLPVGGVTLNTITVTPTDALPTLSAGTFTPATVNLTTGAPSATFTYTPVSNGVKTISVTNNRGLTDPGNLTYTVSFDAGSITGLQGWWKADALALSDGTSVGTWTDSSGHGHDGTEATNKPIYKVNIVNSKPIVRFASPQVLNLSPAMSSVSPWTSIVVMKVNLTSDSISVIFPSSAGSPLGISNSSGDGNLYAGNRTNYCHVADTWTGAFHIFATDSGGTNPTIYIDGVGIIAANVASASAVDFNRLASGVGDIAEILLYNASLTRTDRETLEAYLGTKYGITVITGPAVIPGLALWLKADSIGSPDGTLLSAWNDSSANGYNLSNTGGAARPTLKTNIVNGLPVVRFDGVANKLANATLPSLTQPTTVFVVGKQSVSGTNARWVQSVTGTPSEITFFDTNGYFSLYAGSAVVQDTVNRQGAFHVFTGIFNGASSQTYVDGTLKASGNAGTGGINGVAVMYDPGTGTEFDAGDVAEVIIYNSALGTTDRAYIENWLKAKYATP